MGMGYSGMRLRGKSLLLGLVSLGALALPVHAAVLLDDSWTDGSRAESNLPTESAVWAGVSATSSPPSSVVTTTGKLTLNQGSSSSKIWTYFTSDGSAPDGNQPHNAVQSLGVGDKLTVSLTFTIPSAITSNATSAGRDLRFGVYFDPTDPRVQADTNSDGGGGTNPWTDSTGYGVLIPINSNPTNTTQLFQIGKRTTSNTSLLGATGAYTLASSGGGPLAAQSNISYTAQLELSRVAAGQLDVTARMLSGATLLNSQTVSDTGTAFGGVAIGAGLLPGSQSVYTSFDQMFFRMSSNAELGQIDFTNFKVDYVASTSVPEPASAMLLGIAGIMVVCPRGRRPR
jgi:hypothetical protein